MLEVVSMICGRSATFIIISLYAGCNFQHNHLAPRKFYLYHFFVGESELYHCSRVILRRAFTVIEHWEKSP